MTKLETPAQKLKRLQNKQKREALEEHFLRDLKALKISGYKRNYPFHATKGWMFDFAWPFNHVAVEIEGGTRLKGKQEGRHTRHDGYHEDCNKYNAAAKDGWKVFRFTSEHVKKGEASKFIEDYFNGYPKA